MSNDDDIWASDSDDSLVMMRRDRSRFETQIETHGIVMGIELAKTDENYQEGFNFGFCESAQIALTCGKLKGELTAILIKYQINNLDTDEIFSKMYDLDSIKEDIENFKLLAEDVEEKVSPFTEVKSRLRLIADFLKGLKD